MGGSLSPPGTNLDLEYDIRKLYKCGSKQCESGLQYKNHSMSSIIQGCLHVDDCLVFSRIWCPDCLWDAMRKIWPEDVGLTLESSGPSFEFLHSKVTIVPENYGALEISPLLKSEEFVNGDKEFPTYSKIPPYSLPAVQGVKSLSQVLFCKLCMFDQLLLGRTTLCIDCITSLLTEVLLVGWPIGIVCSVLKSYPHRHQTNFACVVRIVGRMLKRSFKLPISREHVSVVVCAAVARHDSLLHDRPLHVSFHSYQCPALMGP